MKKRSLGILAGAVVSAGILSASAAQAERRRLTVEDVVRLALETNPRMAASRLRAQAADHQRKSAGGRMLPALSVSDEYQHYNSPFDVAFSGGSFRAREADTNTFVAAASQPVLGLLRRSEEYQTQARGAEAADAGVRLTEAAMREEIQVGYLRMFEALAVEEIAHVSEAELAEEVTVTEAQVKAGTLTQADLLRVKVAQANAKQQGIAAHTRAVVARAGLLSAIGLPPGDEDVQFVEPAPLLEASSKTPVSESALENRPEVAQARLTAEAARHEARSRTYAMLPEVDLEAAYSHIDGQVFAPKDSAFVGIRAAWTFFEWGSQYQARGAAAARADAAAQDLEVERRQVRVEVTARSAELAAAANAVSVAEQAIQSAEEAYRVTDVQVRAGAATVTDLLDSQSALTQARFNLTRARYEQAIAKVELERAAAAPQGF